MSKRGWKNNINIKSNRDWLQRSVREASKETKRGLSP